MINASSDRRSLNADRLIHALWLRWLDLLDRYDGFGTATTDEAEAEAAAIGMSLEACALLLCAVPAPTWDAMPAKVVIAAWMRDHAAQTWALPMIETAIARDHLALQSDGGLID